MLRSAPARAVPSETVSAVPVDGDSRLQLLRVESTPRLDVEPIWTGDVRSALESLVRERRLEGRLAAAGLAPTRSVVFTGPPGVGKTLAARWLARELGRPLLTLDLAAVMSSFLGRTGTNLRHVMDFARGLDCVLLLDEFDALAKRRDDAYEIGELKRLVTSLLQEIDSWPARGLLIAATNHPDLLDPAAWRRFERAVEFPMPTGESLHHAVYLFAAEPAAGAGESPLPGAPLLEALALAFDGATYSDIERELLAARRAAIVDERPLLNELEAVLARRINGLPRRVRLRVATCLQASGLSQRQVNQLTGVSRDTLRKQSPETSAGTRDATTQSRRPGTAAPRASSRTRD